MSNYIPNEFADTLGHPIQTGEHLCGRYQVERELGRGGMGVVLLATDTTLNGRPVALKVLPNLLTRDRRSIDRLKAEAEKNFQLTHPNIVRLINFEHDATRPGGEVAFLVMQYVNGRTLSELLAEHPHGIPWDRLRLWANQVASAIDYAHEREVIHCDIKPGNIMIEGDGGDQAYLMDFGLARQIRESVSRVSNRFADSSGTLPYMSPQQIDNTESKSNDIYSFAMTLYEAVSGDLPFRSMGDGSVLIHQIRTIQPPPLRRVSESVNTAILSGLHKDVAQRPASARALVQAAEGAAAEQAGKMTKATGRRSAGSELTGHRGFRLRSAFGIALKGGRQSSGRFIQRTPRVILGGVLLAVVLLVLASRLGSTLDKEGTREDRHAQANTPSTPSTDPAAIGGARGGKDADAQVQTPVVPPRMPANEPSRGEATAAREGWLSASKAIPVEPDTIFVDGRDELKGILEKAHAAQEKFDRGDYTTAAADWQGASNLLSNLMSRHDAAKRPAAEEKDLWTKESLGLPAPLFTGAREALQAATAQAQEALTDFAAGDFASARAQYAEARRQLTEVLRVHRNAQTAAESARSRADLAARLPSPLYKGAEVSFRQAEGERALAAAAFGRGEFGAAESSWQKASDFFRAAHQMHDDARALARKSQDSYQSNNQPPKGGWYTADSAVQEALQRAERLHRGAGAAFADADFEAATRDWSAAVEALGSARSAQEATAARAGWLSASEAIPVEPETIFVDGRDELKGILEQAQAAQEKFDRGDYTTAAADWQRASNLLSNLMSRHDAAKRPAAEEKDLWTAAFRTLPTPFFTGASEALEAVTSQAQVALAAYVAGDFAAARTKFAEARRSLAAVLEMHHDARRAAEAARASADGAAPLPSPLYKGAEAQFRQAEAERALAAGAFGRGEFGAAETSWRRVLDFFRAAKQMHDDARALAGRSRDNYQANNQSPKGGWYTADSTVQEALGRAERLHRGADLAFTNADFDAAARDWSAALEAMRDARSAQDAAIAFLLKAAQNEQNPGATRLAALRDYETYRPDESHVTSAVRDSIIPKGKAPGDSLNFKLSGGDIEFRFRWIPAGSFMIGSPGAEPFHGEVESPRVEISFAEGFWMMETEVTQEQWKKLTGSNPSHFADDHRQPIETVSWNEVQDYIGSLNEQSGLRNLGLMARLPSEAEWEYACRAGTTTAFWTGEELSGRDENHNAADGTFRNRTTAVGSLEANPWGLHDMHGNVREWVQDYWHHFHSAKPTDGKAHVDPQEWNRVVRGGAWSEGAGGCRSAVRQAWNPADRSNDVGFRLVLVPR